MMSLPKDTKILAFCWDSGIFPRTSLILTADITGFGISIPTVFLPGIGASILILLADNARAISLSKLTILLSLVPAGICISN